MSPVCAPAGTVVPSSASERIEKSAATPPNSMRVTSFSPSPRTVTTVPAGPLVGLKDPIEGGSPTTKSSWLVPVPAGVVTLIFPELAPAGTAVRITSPEITANSARVPSNVTAVAPVNPVPRRVTGVPTTPSVGSKERIEGGCATRKSVELVPVPPGVVTVILPLVAPAGTVVSIRVLDATLKVAEVPLKRTLVAPPRSVPVIATAVPTGPLAGSKEPIVGAGGRTVNTPKQPVPPGVVTQICPVEAPAGTVVSIRVFDATLKIATTPLKVTLVAPARSAPVIVTFVPTVPLVGANEVIVGAGGMTVKSPALVAVPPGVVTVILPLVAPTGTDVLIWVPEATVKVANVPLNFTTVAPTKLVPVIVTAAPTRPLVGLNEVMVGPGGVTVKSPALVAVPPGVVTVILPLVAPAGIDVLIWVPEATVRVANVPLKRTAVAPPKLVPVIVTAAPTRPLAGANAVMVGAGGVTVK